MQSGYRRGICHRKMYNVNNEKAKVTNNGRNRTATKKNEERLGTK